MPPFRSLFRSSQPRAQTTETPSPDVQQTPHGANALWRRSPMRAWPMGSEHTAVQLLTSESVHVLPAATADWLLSCTEWTSLEAHLDNFRERFASDSAESEPLAQLVPNLIESNLFLSSEALLQSCKGHGVPRTDHPPIAAIGFPTGGRQGLELAPRAVRSFAENLREYNRQADLLVCDSSLDPALRERQRTQLQEIAQQFGRPVRYAGAEEKQLFAADLVRMGACPPEVAEFALGDPFETGFAPGANRNLLLLDQAGSLFCSIDHDVLCRVTRAPEQDNSQLSLFSGCDPFARWTFADRAEADRTTHWETPDHLALHEAMLGREPDELLSEKLGVETVNVQNAADAILERLARGATQIRATFCGHSGEPGVPSAAYYLTYTGHNRARLTSSEAHYRAALSSRCLLALSPSPAIGDASLSPGVAFGVDHRELLPPFFPVLHAEDFSWSALVWQCCRGAVFGLLPWAVAHEPIPGKAYLQIRELSSTPPFVIWEWAHLLRFWTMTWQPPGGSDAAVRIRSFARVLAEIAALPPADFISELKRAALATASHQIAFYDAQLRSEDEHIPEFWRADVDRYLVHLQKAVTCEGFELPLDLQQQTRSLPEARALAQQLVGRYAALLEAWPDMVAASRELKGKGQGVSAR